MLVKTWEEYCKNKKIDPVASLPDLSGMPEPLRNSFLVDYKLQILIDEVNNHVEANWEDDNEPKYVIVWWMDGVSDAGFRLDCVFSAYSCSYVGSRHTFRNRKSAEHAAKYFFDLFKIYMYGK